MLVVINDGAPIGELVAMALKKEKKKNKTRPTCELDAVGVL